MALVRACHPEPTAAVTVGSAVLAVRAGPSWGGGLLVVAAVLCGQLSIGWANDWLDAARDRSVGRADKPAAVDGELVPVVRLVALVALGLSVVLSLLCGLLAGLVHVVAGVGSGWAYDLGVKRTPWSWAPYLVAFGTLPAFVWLATSPRWASVSDARWASWWLSLAVALLGVGAHLVNAVPDLAADLATGVRGLPQRLGEAWALRVAALLLVGSSLVVVVGPGFPPPVWSWFALGGAAVLATLGVRLGGRAGFRAVICVAAVDVILLLAR